MPHTPPPTDPALQLTGDLPRIKDATMLLAFTGWMDGGDVSTGTVRQLIDKTGAEPFAAIDPEPFCLLHIPGSMETAALFRPHVKIEDGVVTACSAGTNTLYASPLHRLIFFVGREPNFHWTRFGDILFDLAQRCDVRRLMFVGSFGGSVPHTREPRLYATVSDRRLLDDLKPMGVRPSHYSGPGSFATALVDRAARQHRDMISLVAEIPGYLQGINPLSIEAVIRRLSAILGLRLDLASLRAESTEWEIKVSEVVAKDEDLSKHIRDLEEAYDDELIGQPGEA